MRFNAAGLEPPPRQRQNPKKHFEVLPWERWAPARLLRSHAKSRAGAQRSQVARVRLTNLQSPGYPRGKQPLAYRQFEPGGETKGSDLCLSGFSLTARAMPRGLLYLPWRPT